VNFPDGSQLTLSCSFSDGIEDLKTQICRRTGIAVDKQDLVFSPWESGICRILNDASTLENSAVTRQQTVGLPVRDDDGMITLFIRPSVGAFDQATFRCSYPGGGQIMRLEFAVESQFTENGESTLAHCRLLREICIPRLVAVVPRECFSRASADTVASEGNSQ
jgi:hypothetical protein